MTELESLSSKIESGTLFTVSVSYDTDSLRQILFQLLQQVQSNTKAISSLHSQDALEEIPAGVSQDRSFTTRLSALEARLASLEQRKESPPDPHFVALLESEERKELSSEDIVGMVRSLRRETDQRVSRVEQEIRLLSGSSKQPGAAPAEKGGEISFEYNRRKLFV